MKLISLSNLFLLMSILLARSSRRAAAFAFRHQPGHGTTSPAFVSSGKSWTPSRKTTILSQSWESDESYYSPASFSSSSSSLDFAMEPDSEAARLVTTKLCLNEEQHETLQDLVSLVVKWNEKINLVSRRDCTESVVFGRHVLPSLALASLPFFSKEDLKIVDVGTGGGFPGLPLAVCFPESQFLLVDSVGKKVNAVQAMADELGLQNVETHHGRVEELCDDVTEGHLHRGMYDICVGRSVAALPKFCFWVQDLLKKNDGKLLYIIGGDIDDTVLSKAQLDVDINDLLDHDEASDKRILVFDQENVSSVAAASGEKKQQRGRSKLRSNPRRSQRQSKGEWAKKDNATPKQRGYDNFKRYEG